jgi:CRISPR-associated protein Cas1
MLSFVYDIGDLYKGDLTIPVAFRESAKGNDKLEPRVRHACRDTFREMGLLQRIIPDIEKALSVDSGAQADDDVYDYSDNPPGGLWDPGLGDVAGGQNWGDE